MYLKNVYIPNKQKNSKYNIFHVFQHKKILVQVSYISESTRIYVTYML
jgi:hypothetical protein